MIRKKLLHSFLAFAVIAAAGISNGFSDEIKFSDLKSKITIDKAPIANAKGAVVSYADALEKVMPAVVTISSSKSIQMTSQRNPQQEELFRRMFPDVPDDFFERFGQGEETPERRQEGLGSGVIVSPDGYILTNNHVVGGADKITVELSDQKKEYEAELIGADPRTDIALIKIDAKGLTPVTIGDSSKLRIGDVAMAVGNPLGLEQTATLGIISAVGRSELNITNGGYENFIQTDAAINRGNSGGALVDATGRLIGINTAIQSNFTGGNIGIGFAIPSNMALNIVERLLDGGGVVKRGFLGVLLDELDTNFAKALGRDDLSGVLIREVVANTPAEQAGLRIGDLILKYNGKPVDSVQRLRLDISNTAPNSEVEFEVYRKGKAKTVDVKLGELDDDRVAMVPGTRPVAPKVEELIEGVRVKNLDDDTRESLELDDSIEGILVESVKDNVAAARAGLRPGTVITMVDQVDVESVEDAYEVVEKFEGDVLLLQTYAGGRRNILAVPLNE
ncbi:MAG: Do family serine endopeptidase [Verrucomicrobiales bacterium]|nr:Do family serine endopeptidase [Verrucomicrobiales bacterium]